MMYQIRVTEKKKSEGGNTIIVGRELGERPCLTLMMTQKYEHNTTLPHSSARLIFHDGSIDQSQALPRESSLSSSRTKRSNEDTSVKVRSRHVMTTSGASLMRR